MRKIIVGLCLSALYASAQHHAGPAPGQEKPVALYPGMGPWRHPIQTKSMEAQKYFDQGLNLFYGFNRYEALRSFRKAAELDPTAPMAYWGMSMSLGPYINMDGDPSFDLKESCAAVAKGLAIAGATAHERAYLEAAATRCPEYKPDTYVAAMRKVAERWPDDLDAQILLADSLMVPVRWHWYSPDGTPAAGVREAERAIESVLRRWPDHPGANHYYIHAVEASPAPERAIASAQRLMGITPALGHMVHMPGHIWLVLGDWETAANVNDRAVAVDRDYFTKTGVNGPYMMYYLHNLHFVAYARWMQGKKAEGLRAAADMAAVLGPLVEAMPELADPFLAWTSFGRVRFQDWDAVLKEPQPKPAMKTQTMAWRYGRVLALAARGDRAAAVREKAAFDEARKAVPADGFWGNNKAGDAATIASHIVAARLAATPAEAVGYWRTAVAVQDGLTYDEPPGWYYPIRESLGAALIRAGNPAEAEKVFREGVRRSPRNGRMLFGLLESLRAQKKTEDAESVKREFDAAWSKADVALKLEEM
jgi:tetratricopeptide (TPR) repeat protein